MSSIRKIFLAASLVHIMITGEAHAYVDPGTGSYLLQILIAGLLGAAFALKLYWNKLKGFISSSRSDRKKRGDDQPNIDNERE
jgi:hypothetical protein